MKKITLLANVSGVIERPDINCCPGFAKITPGDEISIDPYDVLPEVNKQSYF